MVYFRLWGNKHIQGHDIHLVLIWEKGNYLLRGKKEQPIWHIGPTQDIQVESLSFGNGTKTILSSCKRTNKVPSGFYVTASSSV